MNHYILLWRPSFSSCVLAQPSYEERRFLLLQLDMPCFHWETCSFLSRNGGVDGGGAEVRWEWTLKIGVSPPFSVGWSLLLPSPSQARSNLF